METNAYDPNVGESCLVYIWDKTAHFKCTITKKYIGKFREDGCTCQLYDVAFDEIISGSIVSPNGFLKEAFKPLDK